MVEVNILCPEGIIRISAKRLHFGVRFRWHVATSLPHSQQHLGVRRFFGGAVILRDMGLGGGVTFRPEKHNIWSSVYISFESPSFWIGIALVQSQVIAVLTRARRGWSVWRSRGSAAEGSYSSATLQEIMITTSDSL